MTSLFPFLLLGFSLASAQVYVVVCLVLVTNGFKLEINDEWKLFLYYLLVSVTSKASWSVQYGLYLSTFGIIHCLVVSLQ